MASSPKRAGERSARAWDFDVAVRRIIRMGHPTLRQIAAPVEPADLGSPTFKRLVEDMVDTLRDYGGVGLAAPADQ